MKRLLLFSIVFTILFIPQNVIYASCQRIDNTEAAEQQCTASGKYPRRNYSLTISGTAQCTNSPGNGVYAVCCNEQTEANAVDSVRAPLCGSSEERGKANATCYDCGSGTMKCDGLDFALGSTDPFITQIHNPVSPGDTNTDQVWRIPNASIPSTFTYNGMSYKKLSGDLIVCGSNNLACGSSEECTNIIYPDVNNRGDSGSTPQEASVAESGVPDITTKIKIPNLVSFGQTSTAKDENGSVFSIFSGVKEEVNRSIGKLFGFKDNKVEVPKVYERLGRQLHGALRYFTPMGVQIQPITHELTHSGASTYCYANDKQGGKTQAFPIKGTITIPAPGLDHLRESSVFLTAAMGTETVSSYVLKNLDKLNPNVLANINLNPTCDEPPTAFNVRQRQIGSSDPEEYEVPENDWPVYLRSIRVPDFEAILAAFLGKKCGEVDCKIDREPQESNARFKMKTVYVDEMMEDLVKDKTGKPAGALAAMQPAALQTRDVLHGKTEGNTMIQQLGSNWEDMKNVTLKFKDAGTFERDGEELTNCLLYPQSLQKNLDYRCNFSDNFGQPSITSTSLGTLPSGIEGSKYNNTNNPLTYRIPYRNASCQVSQPTIDKIKDIMTRYYPGYQEAGTANLNRMWNDIQNASIQSSWNPAFALSLWIEESAAGGAPDSYGMGCIYHTYANGARMSKSGGSDEATREQYQCLFERSFDEDFNRLMCTYSGEQRDNAGHCTNFANNPNFIHNVQWWYNQLSQGMSNECQISNNNEI